jgi:hypothetical protein
VLFLTHAILDRIFNVLTKKYGGYFEAPPFFFKGKLRCIFHDSAVLDIFYPDENCYSFQYIKANIIERFDTANHHHTSKMPPNHHHEEKDDHIIEDEVTIYLGDPITNAKSVLNFLIQKYYQ